MHKTRFVNSLRSETTYTSWCEDILRDREWCPCWKVGNLDILTFGISNMIIKTWVVWDGEKWNNCPFPSVILNGKTHETHSSTLFFDVPVMINTSIPNTTLSHLLYMTTLLRVLTSSWNNKREETETVSMSRPPPLFPSSPPSSWTSPLSWVSLLPRPHDESFDWPRPRTDVGTFSLPVAWVVLFEVLYQPCSST